MVNIRMVPILESVGRELTHRRTNFCGHFESRGRVRLNSADDQRAYMKRKAKRRKKAGR